MPTQPYKIDGTRVPSVTTVLSRYKESGGLIHWAWQCGVDGKDYREMRDKAASAGTLCHEMIECHARGVDFFAEIDADQEQMQLAEKGFASYLEWAEQSKLEIVDTEMPLVSKEYRFGGCPDAIGICGGTLSLIDFKTSNRCYPDMVEQLAAYVVLVKEAMGETLERAHLLRVGKEFAEFHHHSWPKEALDLAWESFRYKRHLYELDKRLKKLV